jgi:hypothetical protein
LYTNTDSGLHLYFNPYSEIESEYLEKKRENEILKKEIENKSKTPFQNIKNLVSPRKLMTSESNFEEVQSPRQIKAELSTPKRRNENNFNEFDIDSKKRKIYKENNFVLDE